MNRKKKITIPSVRNLVQSPIRVWCNLRLSIKNIGYVVIRNMHEKDAIKRNAEKLVSFLLNCHLRYRLNV